MVIKREKYLNEIIERKNNNLIKVITGLRRSGKSYLLNKLYKSYLLEHNILDLWKKIRNHYYSYFGIR